MALIQTQQKFLAECFLSNKTNGASIDISKYLVSVSVKESFVSQCFPLVLLKFSLPEDLKDVTRDNEIEFSLKISRYSYDSGTNQESDEDESEPTIEQNVFSSVLRVFTKPYISSSTVENTEDEESDDSDINNKLNIPIFNCEFTTIPLLQLATNRAVINECFSNTRASDAILYILDQNLDDLSLYMEEPDNKETQKDILVPAMNVIPACKYLQTVYGIYSYGFSIFFDFNKCYVFSPLRKKENFENAFSVVIEKKIDTSSSNYKSIWVDPENSNTKLYLENAPVFSSIRKIANDEIGKETVFSSYDNNLNVVNRIVNDSENPDNKVRYFWNEFDNKFFEDSMINMSNSSNELINIPILNVDPNYFNISTRIDITAPKFPYIEGEYSLNEKTYSFISTDKKHFSSSINLSLLKLK